MPTPGLTAPSRPSKALTFRCTEAQHTAVHRLAAELDASISAIARTALARGLEAIEAEHRRA